MNPVIKKLDILINNERTGKNFENYNLADIKKLLNLFGNPHKKIKTIHIAGTNGKGSVAHMLNSILIASGKKTGLYTSPHLVRITERIKINNKEIPFKRLKKYISELFAVLDKNNNLRPTYFDALTLFAFRYFYEEKTDISVIETGLGGRLDSTNVIHPRISIITDISMDHTHILGDTIQKIADEKAGIIKAKSFVVTSNQNKQILNILSRKSRKENSELYVMNKDFFIKNAVKSVNKTHFDYLLNVQDKKNNQYTDAIKNIVLRSPGKFQLANASLAITSALLLRKSGIIISERDVRKGLRTLKIPGRLQTLSTNPLIIFDPAHNPAALSATVEALKEQYPHKNHSAVVTFMLDKDYLSMFKILRKNFTDNIFYYELRDSRCLKISKEKISKKKNYYDGMKSVDNFENLIKLVRTSFISDSLLLITGSFRLYNIARKLAKLN
ncbi:MAG: bifunctional folylpolyglutamate synthase/dihydrofolate synthase [Spirochaetes bacterium]|nr:bifunctional folylpolyglutamate synthase/dihydrofolate synthase [Spirochaetota bacterium]